MSHGLAVSSPWRFADYPAALPHVIGVAALAEDGTVPGFSNRDPIYVDIAAPIGRRRLDLVADEDLDKTINRLTKEMKDAAKNLDFEKAAEIRDRLRELKEIRIFV